jgi:hypothetical protein
MTALDFSKSELDALSIAAEHFIAWLDSADSKEHVSDEDWATLSADLRAARAKCKEETQRV